jgi:phenylacetate-CoA ligase
MRPDSFHSREEALSQDELHTLQSDRLRRMVSYVYERNDVQRGRLTAAGIEPGDINSVEDVTALPMMTKNDFRSNYPLGLSCVEKQRITEMHMSSGSTGAPVVMPYTQADLEQWADCMARCLRMAGAESADVIQITPAFGLFNGGFGFYRGAEELDMFVLPTGSGSTGRQIRLARDFNSRIIAGIVSYGIRFMEVLTQQGEDLPDLEIGLFGAETFSDNMKRKISEGLGIEVFDIYGLTEAGGVGTAMDCSQHCGLHVWEDHYIVEIVDPDTGKPVNDGEFGEMVITSLTRQALPIIRFRTGDLTRIVSREKCACGRTHLRIAPITGRTDDMLIVKGVNFFPKQVEDVLMSIPGVGSNYQIIVEENEGLCDLLVYVETEPAISAKTVERQLKDVLGFAPKIQVFRFGQLPRNDAGKARRVFFKAHTGMN